MILRTLQVQGWRCFADPVRVGPFDERLNVLFAPNGTGKSRLLEALLRAFFDSHRVSGQEADAIRPWGRALAPQVAVEFACGGVDYRLEKRYLDAPAATLRRLEGDRFVALAEGESADQLARELLRGTAPGRGMSRHGHWGHAQVLWASQEGLALAGLSDDSVHAIRSSLGTQLDAPGGHEIEKRVRDLYLQSFTPKGRLKRGQDAPLIARLEERLGELSAEAARARARLEDFEASSRRIRDLERERAQAVHALAEQQRQVGRLREEAQTYAAVAARREALEAQAAAAALQVEDLARRVDRVERLRQDREKQERAAEELRSDRGALEAERQAAAAAEREAETVLEETRRAREGVDEARREAEVARRFRELDARVQSEEQLLERAAAQKTQIDEIESELAGRVAPDGRDLGAIRRAQQKRDQLRAQLDAALITLEVEPLREATIEVTAGDERGARRLKAGEALRCQGSPEVAIEIADVARIRARGPSEGVAETRQALAKAEQKSEDLCAPFGTADLEALERLAEKRASLERRRDEAQARLETLLGESSLEELRQGCARARAERGEILRERAAWGSEPPDPAALQMAAGERQRRQRSDEKTAESRLEAARETAAAAEKRWRASESDLRDAARLLERIDLELAEFAADGLGDGERRERWGEARRARAECDAALADVHERLAAFPGDPRRDLERAERQLEVEQGREREILVQATEAETRLQQLLVEAPYSALAAAEERVAELEAQREREGVRVEAVGLLHDTIARVREAAIEAVARPVEERATRTLMRIAGGRLGGVRLTQRFEPSGVLPPAAPEGVMLEELSAGEREQLYLAVRLALAGVLAGEERQLLVLDDVLTATDGPRLGRIHEILAEAAAHLQILILTCHVERYRALEGARFLDLETMLGR